LLELARDRHFPQLLPHYSFDGLPAPSKGLSLRFCNPAPHLLSTCIIPLSWNKTLPICCHFHFFGITRTCPTHFLKELWTGKLLD